MQEVQKVKHNPKKSIEYTDPRWWTREAENLHKHLFSLLEHIEHRQSYRSQANKTYARVYSNHFFSSLYGGFLGGASSALPNSRMSLNVTKAVIDTVTSKIGKNKPKPLFLTHGGVYSQQRRAEKLTKYVEGVFDDTNLYKKGQLTFRDGCIFGTGAIKLYAHDGRICADRVLSEEIVVDDLEGIYGEPRSMYHRRRVARSILLEAYPEHEEAIVAAKYAPVNEGRVTQDDADMVYFVEAWHLPSSVDANDGLHTICIDGATLVHEQYKKDYFPIVLFYWTPPVVGFFGMGIVEEILGIQIEINKLLQDIQRAMHLIGVPSIWLEHGSGKPTAPITNEIGNIYYYHNRPPTFYTPASMNNDVYQHVWNLYRRAFEIVGVSELSATLKKPAGIESKVALREYSDIETERFAIVAQEYEQFYLKIAEVIVDLSRDLYAEDSNLVMKVKGGKFIETIRWEDVDLEDDKFIMDAFPISMLPSTPSGRLERVSELVEGGFIDQRHAAALLDFPDLESVISLETASLDTINYIMERIVEKGEYISPEPMINLELAIKIAQNTYLKAKLDGVEEEKLKLLLQFMNACEELLQQALAATQPVPANMPDIEQVLEQPREQGIEQVTQ